MSRPGAYLAQAATPLQARLPVATDVDHDAVTYALQTEPLGGVVSIQADGGFSYLSNSGFLGADSFTFTVKDGMGGSNTYTARLHVAAVEHAYRGSASADIFTAQASADGYTLLGGDDQVTGGDGADVIDGGDGLDLAIYAGQRANFSISHTSTHWTVADRLGVEGSDRLINVERLQFADSMVALDMDANSPGGQTAQIIRALFGAPTLKVAEFNGYGVVLLDRPGRHGAGLHPAARVVSWG